jgi:hypothetical protein
MLHEHMASSLMPTPAHDILVMFPANGKLGVGYANQTSQPLKVCMIYSPAHQRQAICPEHFFCWYVWAGPNVLASYQLDSTSIANKQWYAAR